MTHNYALDFPNARHKNMPKRVLVLLAAHNGIRWIAEQLESIRKQERVEVTILASDDASIDGTYEYLRSAPGVSVFPERGPYGSAGRNFFHLLARADFSGYDYFAFSDQDDIWYPWKLSRAVDCLDRSVSGRGAYLLVVHRIVRQSSPRFMAAGVPD